MEHFMSSGPGEIRGIREHLSHSGPALRFEARIDTCAVRAFPRLRRTRLRGRHSATSGGGHRHPCLAALGASCCSGKENIRRFCVRSVITYRAEAGGPFFALIRNCGSRSRQTAAHAGRVQSPGRIPNRRRAAPLPRGPQPMTPRDARQLDLL